MFEIPYPLQHLIRQDYVTWSVKSSKCDIQRKVCFLSLNESVETVSLSNNEREQIQEFAKRTCSMSHLILQFLLRNIHREKTSEIERCARANEKVFGSGA